MPRLAFVLLFFNSRRKKKIDAISCVQRAGRVEAGLYCVVPVMALVPAKLTREVRVLFLPEQEAAGK